jgi:hypothetical protein
LKWISSWFSVRSAATSHVTGNLTSWIEDDLEGALDLSLYILDLAAYVRQLFAPGTTESGPLFSAHAPCWRLSLLDSAIELGQFDYLIRPILQIFAQKSNSRPFPTCIFSPKCTGRSQTPSCAPLSLSIIRRSRAFSIGIDRTGAVGKKVYVIVLMTGSQISTRIARCNCVRLAIDFRTQGLPFQVHRARASSLSMKVFHAVLTKSEIGRTIR